MKELYKGAELEIIRFETDDVLISTGVPTEGDDELHIKI